MERAARIELVIVGLEDRCSTIELRLLAHHVGRREGLLLAARLGAVGSMCLGEIIRRERGRRRTHTASDD